MMKRVKKYVESWYYCTFLYGKMRTYLQPYLSTEFNIHEIVPSLFIGDIASAFNAGELEKLGITHIVTAILGVGPIFPDKFTYINIPLRDIPTENINAHFKKSNEFIKNAIDGGGKVFIHCICGVSRSATLLAAFLIQEYGMDFDGAINHLKNKREVVSPNLGFLDQLENFEHALQSERIFVNSIKKRRHSV